MQIDRPRRSARQEDRILPLINIVFLLLVFFMVAGHLAARDPLSVEPPASRSEGLPDAGIPLLLLAADGRLALDGAVLARAALEETLRSRAGGVPDRVRVKADREVEALALADLLAALRGSGVGAVELLTTQASP